MDTACDATTAAALKGATACDFFATPVVIGRTGIVKNLGLGALSEYVRTLSHVVPCNIVPLKPLARRGRTPVAEPAAARNESCEGATHRVHNRAVPDC